MMKNLKISLAAGSVLLLASCANQADGWKLTGDLPAGSPAIVVEAPTAGGSWYVVDSIVTPGHFEMKAPRVPHSTIMRLRSGAATAYFPVDSTETLTLNSADFTVGGTEGADLFAAVEKAMRPTSEPDSVVKRNVLALLSGKYDSHAAYYVVKKEGFLDPVNNSVDFTLYRAVANSFNGLHPDDPRTAPLIKEYLQIQAQRRANKGEQAQQSVVYAPEIGYYEIALPDAKGTERKLSDVAESHKVTVLNFMNFADPNVGLLNAALGTAYEKYASQGLAIYQVGVDMNPHVWSNVAKNLPWTSVYQSETAPSTIFGQYGVSGFPTTFIIVNGELTKRVDDLNELSSNLKPYF